MRGWIVTALLIVVMSGAALWASPFFRSSVVISVEPSSEVSRVVFDILDSNATSRRILEDGYGSVTIYSIEITQAFSSFKEFASCHILPGTSIAFLVDLTQKVVKKAFIVRGCTQDEVLRVFHPA